VIGSKAQLYVPRKLAKRRQIWLDWPTSSFNVLWQPARR
jgi:hypothetical protein